MNSKKKVLHLFANYEIGGVCLLILKNIQKTNQFYDYYIAGENTDAQMFKEFQKASKEAFEMKLSSFSIKSLFCILKKVKTLKPDVIHAHGKWGAFYLFFIQLFFLKRNHYKSFYTPNGFNYRSLSFFKSKIYFIFEKLLNHLITYGIAVSISEKKYYAQKTKINPDRILYIPNPTEVSPKPLPNFIANKLKSYKINIITLSRTSIQKDLITMLKAFEKLNSENTALHIMGGYTQRDIPYKAKVDKIFENLKNKNNVLFWGNIPDVRSYIHHFNIYWSTAIWEGLPGGVIETMMSKTLIVGTNCRGNIDLIEHQKTGFLTQMENIEDNYLKIKEAIQVLDTEKSKKIIENAYEKSKDFSMEKHIRKIKNLYG